MFEHFLPCHPPFYESSCSVKRERTVAAPVSLPFFYPSIGVSLAPVGCFEVALAAHLRTSQRPRGVSSSPVPARDYGRWFLSFPWRLWRNLPIVQDLRRQPI